MSGNLHRAPARPLRVIAVVHLCSVPVTMSRLDRQFAVIGMVVFFAGLVGMFLQVYLEAPPGT